MKRCACLLVIVIVLGFLAWIPADAEMGRPWVLYDDFDSGIIDPNLWEIDNSSAKVEIEEGKLKITHHPNTAGVSSGLRFKANPEGIKAVKATVIVESITGDLQARIGGIIGEELDGSIIFWRIAVRKDGSDRDRIDCYAGEGAYNRHYTELINTVGNPVIELGESFEIGLNFNRRILKCWAKGFRKDFYFPFPSLLSTEPPFFKQIGTRAQNDSGSGVVFFDDVYVRY